MSTKMMRMSTKMMRMSPKIMRMNRKMMRMSKRMVRTSHSMDKFDGSPEYREQGQGKMLLLITRKPCYNNGAGCMQYHLHPQHNDH